jgi:hypothetical protein
MQGSLLARPPATNLRQCSAAQFSKDMFSSAAVQVLEPQVWM